MISSWHYSEWYAAALVVGLALAVFSAWRSRLGRHDAALIILGCVWGGALGAKLLAVPASHWMEIVSGNGVLSLGGKSFWGGLVGAMIGVAITRRVLKITHSMQDIFVWSLPLVLALARMGCWVGGCCMDDPAVLPWSAGSESRHPIPLYEMIFAGLMCAAIPVLRRKVSAPGNVFYLLAGGYAAFRCGEEFIRPGQPTVLGLEPLQWGMMFSAAAIGWVIWTRERDFSSASVTENFVSRMKTGWFLATVGITFGMMWPSFSTVERCVVAVVLGSSIAALWVSMQERIVRYCVVTVAVLGVPVWALWQSPSDSSSRPYTTIGAGGMIGTSEYHVEDCDGNTVRSRKYLVETAGGRVAHTFKYGSTFVTVGASGFAGRLRHRYWQVDPDSSLRQTYGFSSVSPFVHWDGSYFGAGVGYNFGTYYTGESDGWRRYGSKPFTSVWLGRQDKIYVEAQLFGPYPMGLSRVQYGAFIAAGNRRGTHGGLGIGDQGLMWYLQYVHKRGLVLTPTMHLGPHGSKLGIGMMVEQRLYW